MTDVTALPVSRAAASARASSSTLRRFSTVSGRTTLASIGLVAVARSATVSRAAASTPGRAGGRGLGRLQESLGREIGGVREAGRIAPNDAQAGAPVATGDELLDPTVVETTARRAPILDEDLREITAAAQRVVERGLQHIVFDQGSSHVRLENLTGVVRSERRVAPTCRVGAGLPMVSGWGSRPVSQLRSR